MYNPIYGKSKAPSKHEVELHKNSWWVQADHSHGYQSWHFHTVDSVLGFIEKSKSAGGHLLWRPYFRETGILRTEWPVEQPYVAMAAVAIEHDGTGTVCGDK